MIWKKSEEFNLEVNELGKIRTIDTKEFLVFDRRFTADSVIVNGKQIPAYVIIADAFLGPMPAGYHLHFKNGKRRNVVPENLEYRVGEKSPLRKV